VALKLGDSAHSRKLPSPRRNVSRVRMTVPRGAVIRSPGLLACPNQRTPWSTHPRCFLGAGPGSDFEISSLWFQCVKRYGQTWERCGAGSQTAQIPSLHLL